MNDILGKAIMDFWKGDTKTKLWVHDHLGPKVEMKRAVYFRTWEQMSPLEQYSLQLCTGKILDVGAGAGAHSLVLQQQNKEVYALDISEQNCQVMRERGVQNVIQDDFFQYSAAKFDTLLFIMNGIGISGNLDGFVELLTHSKRLLNPNGKILLDSSDLSYLYNKANPIPKDRYYGEIDCAYSFKGKMSEIFTWLYLDFDFMLEISQQNGWKCEKKFDDGDDQFLVMISQL